MNLHNRICKTISKCFKPGDVVEMVRDRTNCSGIDISPSYETVKIGDRAIVKHVSNRYLHFDTDIGYGYSTNRFKIIESK